jgi:hypothetical protein
MALGKCSECDKIVSSSATRCPRCGSKDPHGMDKMIFVIVILLLVLGKSLTYSDTGIAFITDISEKMREFYANIVFNHLGGIIRLSVILLVIVFIVLKLSKLNNR